MSAIHQMPQAQAGRIVAALVTGSRVADTQPPETDTHPGSDVLPPLPPDCSPLL